MKRSKADALAFGLALGILAAAPPAAAQQPQKKPNIVVFWGDDIGQSNISAYSKGMMGYRTPNIDRVANEGMLFTDYYAEQSCTAGRSAFITGQSVFRTGLSKVGTPGAPLGMRAEDPTIAELLKPLGYATGQFGKNHLGDRDEQLPTMHGFDEFYGNLYHLNAEEEPELRDYPPAKDYPDFLKKFGPRGVLHTWANPDGTQKIENTGLLTKKRMETIDDDIVAKAEEWITRQQKAGKPFFVWINTTHMHFRTHEKPESRGQAGRWQSEYHDVMIDHDKNVGQILALLDKLASRTTRFSSTRRTTARTKIPGPTRARRPSAARRTQTGRGRSESRPWCAGPATSRPERCPTKSSVTWTGCPRFWQRRATRTPRTSSSRATRSIRLARRRSRSIWTATTCCPISRVRSPRARARSSSTSRTTAT